jgi:hypothetical protein
MDNFNYINYKSLKANQVLRFKLVKETENRFAIRVYQRKLQPDQPTHTPIKEVTLVVIKDLELHKQGRDKPEVDQPENYFTMEILPQNIVEHEIVDF